MRRRYLLFPLVAISLALAVPTVTRAGVPDRNASTWPRHVLLVGTSAGGAVDPAGRMDFTICRATCAVREGYSLIVFDFSQSPGIEFCSPQPDPALIVDCPTRTVRCFADAQGNASFSIAGRFNRSVIGSHAPSCKLIVDGVEFGTMPVAAVDEDGYGLGAADISLWQQDYFSGPYWERSDFDGDGTLSAADLSIWLSVYFVGGSTRSCIGNACP